MATFTFENKTVSKFLPDTDWKQVSLMRLVVALIEESEGGYSAIALNLPGAASQGETTSEALTNVRDAAIGCITEYEESGQKVPWEEFSRKDIPVGARVFAINL